MSFCFLTLLVWSKCISYLRYAREEAFTRTKFHKFPEFFAKVYQFTNFKNLQMFLVAISRTESLFWILGLVNHGILDYLW